MRRMSIVFAAVLLGMGCAATSSPNAPDVSTKGTNVCALTCQTTHAQCTAGCAATISETISTCQDNCGRVFEDCNKACKPPPPQNP